MFYVKGVPLMTDEMSVLYKLRDECSLAGLNLFHIFRRSGNTNIMTTCPFHKSGQERKPSFGIAIRDGTCHCFSCGWAGPLNLMISNVFGYQDDGKYGERWLSRNFLSYDIEIREPLKIIDRRNSKNDKTIKLGFTEEELEKYRYIHPYMYERGLTDEIIEDFDIGYDIHSDCLTFPVYRIDKTPAFIARRSVRTKYFNYPENTDKPVYSAFRFYLQRYEYAVICESIFNALTCWKWGLPAVALLGTGSYSQYKILRDLPVRKFILALDPDKAGREGSEKLRKYLSPYKLITQYAIPEGKDINDLDEAVLELVEFF